MIPQWTLDEVDGDLRSLMGLWATATAAHRGLVPAPEGDLAAWWLTAAARMAEGVPSALYVDPVPLEGPVIERVLEVLCKGADEGVGPIGEASVDPGVLGDVYGTLGASSTRKQVGRFYTPRAWVMHALPAELSAEAQILDPACGGGRFLLGALDRIAPGPPSPQRAEIAERCLYGVDADPLAVAICQAAVHLACATPRRFEVAIDVNIEAGDPLLGLAAARRERGRARDQLGLFAPPPPPRPALDGDPRARRARMRGWRVRQAALFRGRRALVAPHLKADETSEDGEEALSFEPVDLDLLMPTPFDVVIGNPPYRGGRHGPLPAADELYRQTFEVAEYQLDPYALFLELGLECLKPGGTLAMVVPNAWMSNLKAGRLRRLLVGEHTTTEVLELPQSVFGAGVETVVVRVQAGGRTGPSIPVLGWAPDAEDVEMAPTARGSLIVTPERPEAPLPLSRDAETASMLVRSRHWRVTLGDVAELTRGVNPYHRTTHTPEQIAARVHHADHAVNDTYVPELRGRELGAYRLWLTGRYWLSYGPWLKEPRDPRFFEGPRLLVRKVLGETLCAAYTEDPLCCDQSVYIARLLEGQPWPPGALLAIICSEAVTRLLRARHQADDRLFPQLKLGELRRLPLPPVAPRDVRLHALSDQALRLQALEAECFEAIQAEVLSRLPEGDVTARARLSRRLIKQGWPESDPEAPAHLVEGRAEARRLRGEIESCVSVLYGLPAPASASMVAYAPAAAIPSLDEEIEMSERGLLSPGDPLPSFSLLDDHGQTVTDDDFADRTVVLYFYPKDDTPGCTKESCDFRDNLSAYTDKGVVIYGISADSVESHQAFRDKFNLNFPLIADPEHTLCDAFGVWGQQSWQGHTFMGIARTTYVIKDKVVAKVYPDVSVVDHATTVLADLG
ncbi:MAG: redoxin domain-containing protein [Bradymonadia bacterium]